MKKEYKKPLINIDDFEVTERIAGACADTGKTVITNFHDGMCVLKWQEYFADGVCKLGDPGEPDDPDAGWCLDTYAETMDYFWS